jgi:RHS repeat-associated protein
VSTPVSSYTYQLGPTGIRTGATEGNGRSLTWNYDGIYRLTNETISNDPANNGSASYGLDPVGNRLSAVSSLTSINSGSWTYNPDDEISSESYDPNGNVISAGGYTMTYDAENHLISKTGNGKVITMVYDAFGNRVSKTVNGVTTQYLVEDDVNPTGLPQVFEELVNGVVTRQYTYGLQRISENLSPTVTGTSTWTPSFYGYDGAGSVRQLTNSTGQVTDEYEYDAFGNSFTKQGTTPNNFMYRGEQFDADLSLYYLRARYYNPATGRFLSRDPADGQTWNPKSMHKYIYASGNPVNRVDPRGREDLVEFLGRSLASIKPSIIFANTFSCTANIGILAVSSGLGQTLSGANGIGGAALGWGGLASTSYGCATVAWVPATDTFAATLNNTAGMLGCGLGLVQTLYDLNEYSEDPTETNLDTYWRDWTGAAIGCSVTLVTATL